MVRGIRFSTYAPFAMAAALGFYFTDKLRDEGNGWYRLAGFITMGILLAYGEVAFHQGRKSRGRY